MSDLEQFMADVKQEGQPLVEALADKEKEIPADPPPAKEPEEEAKKEEPKEGEETKVENTPEEDLPFHKHPRWIERENDLKTFRERDEITTKELAELKAFKEEIESRVTPPSTEIPEWFKELHGDNEFAYKKYVEHEQKRDETIKARVIEEQKEEQRKAKEEETKWIKWIDDEVIKLESKHGKVFDRNDLIQTILKYKPTDEHNNFDFNAGFEIYQALHKEDPAKSNARKELADTTTRSTKSDKPQKDFLTSNDLRNKSWFNL